MKKKRTTFLLLWVCLFALAGCGEKTADPNGSGILVDGVFYEKSEQPMSAEVDACSVIGNVRAYTDAAPDEEGETNISRDLIDAPYARVDGGIAILIGGEWYLCRP